jgi:lipoyl(octanoyl) transferase
VTAPTVAAPAAHSPARLTFEYPGFGAAAVDYRRAWALQRDLHGRRVRDESGDVVLLLEHPPVYTAGRRTEPGDRPVDGTPVIEVDRGGKITWHGPGQLVGYPVCKLPPHVYVVDYVRRLEEALIRACADVGVPTGRVSGRTGVWVAGDDARVDRKVAAIGVRVSSGVTMHGFALNCDNDSAGFDAIIPCGISDAEVTTLSAELGRTLSVRDALPFVERRLSELLAWGPYDRSPDISRVAPPPDAARATGASIAYGLQIDA